MIKLVLLLASLGQFEDSLDKSEPPKPFSIRPEIKREIYEASEEAALWARITALNLNRVRGLEHALKQAAYRQICEAYSITPKQFNQIYNDPRISQIPLRRRRLPKPVNDNGKPGIAMRVKPNLPNRTMFDSSKVRLSDAMARASGYQNPPDPRQGPKSEDRPNVP